MSRESPCREKCKPPCYRMTLLGTGAVGKTAILKRFLNDEFVEKYRETVEDLHVRTFQVNGRIIQSHIFDTSGTIQFPAMRRLSIGNAQAFLLVYDLTSEYSFRVLEEIVDEIKDVRTASELRDLPIVIAGNKCDAPIDEWKVTRQMINRFMINEMLDFRAVHLETSAKSGQKVKSIFETFIKISPMFLNQKMPRSPASIPASLAMAIDFVRIQAVGESGSPVQEKRHQKAQRRFSLQTVNSGQNLLTNGRTSSYAITEKDLGPSAPNQFRSQANSFGDQQKMQNGTHDEIGALKKCNAGSKRAKFFRRNKTKSHDEFEIPECMVQ